MRILVRTAAVLAVLLGVGGGARADVAGKILAVDGDSFEIDGRLVQLFGIRAPDVDATCVAGAQPWPCGRDALYALIFETAGQWIRCRPRHRDAGGLIHAVCTMGPKDVASVMVRAGWAVADRDVTDAYVEAEREARSRGAGIWRGAAASPGRDLREQPGPESSAPFE